MKVYLVRTEDFRLEYFENVLNLLNGYPGAIEFIDGGTLDLDAPHGLKRFNNKTKFEHQEVHYNYAKLDLEFQAKYIYSPPQFPFEKKYYTWEQLFDKIDRYKFEEKIEEKDFVFLLTNEYNEKNWFAFIGPSLRNGFIHTDDWPWFFGEDTDVRYPISYEVTVWIMRGLMYHSQREIVTSFHKKTLGCINDFCKNKNEITIKMRTADVCDVCMNLLKNRDVKPHYLNQLFSIMDGIRSNLMFRKRSSILNQDSRIQIDLDAKKVFLIDYGNLDVRLNPKEMALYLLFLRCPQGIALNSLVDYREELFHLYQKISGRSNFQEMSNTIYLLTNYLEGELSTTLSRIKNKFKKALGEELAKNYFIQNLPTGVHGIPLDRERVKITFE
jgi:hypothetical protein